MSTSIFCDRDCSGCVSDGDGLLIGRCRLSSPCFLFNVSTSGGAFLSVIVSDWEFTFDCGKLRSEDCLSSINFLECDSVLGDDVIVDVPCVEVLA